MIIYLYLFSAVIPKLFNRFLLSKDRAPHILFTSFPSTIF
ncbi:MAG: hypothetical protein ANABAC_0714 [Anaerolineae bacterium]|nr:MAG: hypothetical protein ANABAC_0714 [Anaerolineae bacterium]